MNVDNTGRVLNYYSDDDINCLEEGSEKTEEYIYNTLEEKVEEPLLEIEIQELD
jgi:hypothetical protein